ncbi:nuclear transport factor 2 family protein [Fibrisoma limi]|nr:nuclear transport factor 2 family protein [Fibrisoma limi]
MDAQLIQTLQATHIAAWNEKDRTKRATLLQSIYADTITMYDKELVLHGIEAVSDFIEKLQREDPAFQFSAAKPIESVQNGVRLYGHIDTAQGRLNSMDFFVMDEGKVLHLYAFIDIP